MEQPSEGSPAAGLREHCQVQSRLRLHVQSPLQTSRHAVVGQAHRKSEKFLVFKELAIFGYEFDMNFRVASENRHDVTHIMSTAPVVDFLNEIQELATLEQQTLSASATENIVDERAQHQDGIVEVCDTMHGSSTADNAVLVVVPEVKVMMTKSDGKDETDFHAQMVECARRVDTFIFLGLEEGDITGSMRDRTSMQAARRHVCASGQQKYVLHIYDLKCAGEASSHAPYRVAPLRGNGEHWKRS